MSVIPHLFEKGYMSVGTIALKLVCSEECESS
jgi:hypothetical protein